MQIEVDVSAWYDWRTRHHTEVQPDDVALVHPLHGPDMRLVQDLNETPAVTQIVIPDHDIDRMVADHEEAVRTARAGYTVEHEGGPQHGQQVSIPPRHLPSKGRHQLIAEHLADAVMPFHAPGEHVRAVRITDSALPEAETRRLERYLNARLVGALEEEPEADEPPRQEEPA